MKKALIIFSQILVVAYTTICIFFYFVQDSIIFKPSKLDKELQLQYSFNFEERFYEVDEGIELNAVLAKADSTVGLIFFCHGNQGSVQTDPLKFQIFLNLGYDVFYFDYRGYGKSDGTIESQDQLISDVNTLYKEIIKEYDETEITVLGYSIGTGIASKVAAMNNPKNVMLWTPYLSMIDMKNANYPYLPTFLMKFPLRTYKAIEKIEEPITIFYAEKDEVLPIKRSLALNEFLKNTDEYIVLEGQRHGGVYYHPEMISKLPYILEKEKK